jgi:hypothetical protein
MNKKEINVAPCVNADKSFKLFTDQILKRIVQAFGISHKILYSTPNERHPSRSILRQQQKSCKWALIDPEKEKKAMEVAKRQGIR